MKPLDPFADAWPDVKPRRCCPSRQRMLLLLFPLFWLISLGHTHYKIWHAERVRLAAYHGLPDYAAITQYERALPQHNPDLPFPEGRHGRYLRFSHPVWNIGFNNVLQEVILLSQLAHLSNRAYVYHWYLWTYDPAPVVEDGPGNWRSSRIPLNAFITGASAGGPMPAPRAVLHDYWEEVCPEGQRLELVVSEVNKELGLDKYSDGVDIMTRWAKKLGDLDHPCVIVHDGHVFDFDTIGKPPILSVWPALSQSPILTHFRWSPLVLNAVARNLHLVSPIATFDQSNPINFPPPDPAPTENALIPGLVAIHLRRGDYAYHCENLANWSVTFTGWNQFVDYPDRFIPPAEGGFGSHTEKSLAIYMRHCWPTFEQVREKLAAVRRETAGDRLERVFILTNGDAKWTKSMKDVLLADGWKKVVASQDLKFTPEEVEIDGPVDMQIAVRAQAFVGNGFSSLTSNVNMLRLAHNTPRQNIRFL